MNPRGALAFRAGNGRLARASENRRSAASLVAAFRTPGEKKFLAEAMQKFPNDPQVAFDALFNADHSPEERRKWIDALSHDCRVRHLHRRAPQCAEAYR